MDILNNNEIDIFQNEIINNIRIRLNLLDEEENIFMPIVAFVEKDSANKLVKAYKNKLQIDKNNKHIGDVMCSPEGNLNIYRNNISELIQNKTIQNIYLLYCKVGSKQFGLKNNKQIIKEIKNSSFVNVSFKSTNLEKIKFTKCKFIDTTLYLNKNKNKYQLNNIKKFYLKKISKSIHKNLIDTVLDFNNVNLKESSFTDCYFYNMETDVNNFVNLNYIENCIFEYCKNIVLPNNYKNIKFKYCDDFTLNELHLNTKGITELFKCTNIKINSNEISQQFSFININNNNINLQNKNINLQQIFNIKFIASVLVTDYYYENCDFENNEYNNNFINFIQIDSKKYYLFENKYFKNCNFLSCKFKYLIFKNIIFDNCNFDFCKFENILFNSLSHFEINNSGCIQEITQFKNCKLNNSSFNTCNFSHINQGIFFDYNCIFNKCIFQRNILDGFKFNTETNSNNILKMHNSDFVCNTLIGTNFDNCDLLNSKFSARTNCTEVIGKFLIKNTYIDTNIYQQNETQKLKNIINLLFEVINNNDKDLSKYINTQLFKTLINNRQIITSNIIDNNEYNNIKQDKRFFIKNEYIILVYPSTSFNNTIIKGCNFQQIEGFNNFDFTQISKDENGRPDLRSTNFTACELQKANFENANLNGTVFQFATVTECNFQGTIYNENTDFGGVVDFNLAYNTDHINIEGLQNAANETHARAKISINNRNNIYELFDIFSQNNIIYNNLVNSEFNQLISFFDKIKELKNINENDKFKDLFITLLKDLLKFYKLESKTKDFENNFDKIISQEFLNIIFTKKQPIPNGTPNEWYWLDLILDSFKLLLCTPKKYVIIYFDYYFNEVFNAHGQNSMSCTLGMIERFVTIHSQVAETFISLLTDNINDSNIHQIMEDNTININYIKNFLNPKDAIGFNKYTLNRLINLIKPNSSLPENPADPDITIELTDIIKDKDRQDFDKYAITLIKVHKIFDYDTLEKEYIIFMQNIILKNNDIDNNKINDLKQLKHSVYNNVFNLIITKINKYIEDNLIPELKLNLLVMSGIEIDFELDSKGEPIYDKPIIKKSDLDALNKQQIHDYLAGGSYRKIKSLSLPKTKKLSLLSPQFKYLSSSKTKKSSLLSQRFKFLSSSKINTLSDKDIYKFLLKIFVSLSYNIKKQIYENNKIEHFVDLRDMDIRFKDYRKMLLYKYNKIYYKKLIKNKYDKKLTSRVKSRVTSRVKRNPHNLTSVRSTRSTRCRTCQKSTRKEVLLY